MGKVRFDADRYQMLLCFGLPIASVALFWESPGSLAIAFGFGGFYGALLGLSILYSFIEEYNEAISKRSDPETPRKAYLGFLLAQNETYIRTGGPKRMARGRLAVTVGIIYLVCATLLARFI